MAFMVPIFSLFGGLARLNEPGQIGVIGGMIIGGAIGVFFGLVFGGANGKWLNYVLGPEVPEEDAQERENGRQSTCIEDAPISRATCLESGAGTGCSLS
jgi:hypothetical protein